MAAITFPASPANNDIHTVGTRSWQYNGTAWKLVPKTTDAILEGSNNLYYTEDRVASAPAVSALEGRASAIEADITGMGGTLSSEIQRATAADAALGTRIDNVLSNVDDAALDSLTEIVSAFQAADADLNGAITNLANAAGSDLTALEGRVSTAESDIDSLEGRLDTVEAEKAPIDSPTFTGVVNATEIVGSNIMGTEAVGGIVSEIRLNDAAFGGNWTFEESLTVNAPTADGHAVRKQDLDAVITGQTQVEEINFGDMTLGNGYITDSGKGRLISLEEGIFEGDWVSYGTLAVPAPTDPDHAVRKQDLDSKQTKNVLSAEAPEHVEGLIWIDTTDMSAYVSYGEAWIEMDRI